MSLGKSKMSRREFLSTGAGLLAAGAFMSSGLPALAEGLFGQQQTVLITGAGSGFGRRMALTYARAGYRTYASMREPDARNRSKAQSLRDEAARQSLPLFVIELDVTSPESARRAVDTVMEREGRIDVLVNNAGIFVYTPIELVPRELWELQMRTNVFGPMELTGLVLPHMRARGSGLVINVSSRVGRVIVPGISLYATSKFALETAVEALHYECTLQGIDMAIIQPTAFDTDINRNARRIFSEISYPLLTRERPDGARFHRQFLETLDNNFRGQPQDDPQRLADLALEIVRTPRARRVLRYPVGWEGELKAVREHNAFTARLQETALHESGYGDYWRH
jgi:NAD(P)-dependent dehydrogenase (short-subunit alcohol dehydrogenase family)